MTNSGPSKSDIEAVFNRLRSQATNKSCFDCGAKNPTWASVTYGVFICIDCSAVHRGLGVHLTFVRSTNLDTNWTWVQLRQMQVGGNASASQFFRQHNCNTSDAQQKYTSRAAQLYRDKLQHAAHHAMKIHGTKLHLDHLHEKHDSESNKHHEDFFAECSNDNLDFFDTKTNNNDNGNFMQPVETSSAKKATEAVQKDAILSNEQPRVDLLNSPHSAEPHKSTIGVRKIQPKKSGLGAKKGGLGATKVKANFADIEQKAILADQHKDLVPEKKITEEEEIEQVTSVRLAYQDLSIKKAHEEEKLKAINPEKAKQMERLGMGFNVRSVVSHSAITDMQTIAQESGPKPTTKVFEREPSANDFFDEYSTPMYSPSKQDKELEMMGFETIEPIESNHSNIQTMFSQPQSSKSSVNEQLRSKPRNLSNAKKEYKTYENDTAQKKFGSAKGISSDQFFGDDQTVTDRSANLARFQGSNSISSSDFFGDGTQTNKTSHKSFNTVNFNAPDLDDVKESVRQGVTKVAGKLSSLANDVMSSLHDKYGY